jgi:Spy/CpxP family protein refolding chaperone
MNRWIQRVVTFATFSGALAVLPAGVAFAQTPQDAAAQHTPGHHRRGHQQGVLGAALKLDSLTPEQRGQIEQLVAARRAAGVSVHQADAQLLTVLAQQTESARVDTQAQAPAVAAERVAAMNEMQVDRAALIRLHAILTPAQRAQLVDAVEAHAGGRGQGGHAGQGAEGWKRGRGPQGAGEKGGFERGGGKLQLSPEQRAQIKAAMGPMPDKGERKTKMQAKRAAMHEALESFRGDAFQPGAMVHGEMRTEREVRRANAMIPVLTPNQRATFADQLRHRAAREGRG